MAAGRRIVLDRDDAAKALDEVRKLEGSSQQITEVLDTVQNPLCQTDLLSINASIEAARAGKVRQMAEGSCASAETISRRVQAIQTNVSTVGSRLGASCEFASQISGLTSEIKVLTNRLRRVEHSAQQMLRSMDGVYRLSADASDAVSKAKEVAELLRTWTERRVQMPGG